MSSCHSLVTAGVIYREQREKTRIHRARTTPKITIIGAGPSGTPLARLLSLSSIPYTLFESDTSPNYRSQGGTLDLHTSTGLLALQRAQLFDEFLKYARYDGDHLQITDHNLKVFLKNVGAENHDGPGVKQARPEIDRAKLRQFQTESVPAQNIVWGARVKSLEKEAREGGTWRIIFYDGNRKSEGGFTLAIGANGAFSKVRSTVLSVRQPDFAGIGVYDMIIPEPEKKAPEVYKAVNRGNIFAHKEGIRLALQQLGDGSIGIYRQGFNTKDLEEVKKRLLAPGGLLDGWAGVLREAIERWEHVSGVTLVGDATHLMTLYAGEGVNVAFEDSMRLAQGIVDAVRGNGGGRVLVDVLDNAVREYEGEMWVRAEKAARLTDELTKLWMFTPGTPGSVIAKTTALHVNFHTPPIMQPFATVGVHAWVAWKKWTGW
ncbi:putative tetracycline resistance protein from transposon protein [Podospora fimiseda]|uniref:Tetracycline resistance protein from transposon protein n=1 Tax=Podospora fimiseda TaxID=252190 RepID=A0AAN7BSK2_9PEZI|nr:putative tetracycline resistance protein from transposon protein [Podospora fimiseda]